LINWVNSLEYPNCLLASELSEFKNGISFSNQTLIYVGVIFCEIVNEIILKNQKPDFLPKIKQNNPTFNDILENIRMALFEIKSIRNYDVPRHIHEIRDSELTNVPFLSRILIQ
jgi:hypothetical protein